MVNEGLTPTMLMEQCILVLIIPISSDWLTGIMKSTFTNQPHNASDARLQGNEEIIEND